jgi:hypothetical protein
MFGTVLCLSGSGPALAKMLVSLWFKTFGKDGYLKPIILKNLDQHGQKNMKSNLMYAMTTCFLVYMSASQDANEKYLSSMGEVMFGAHITLRSVNEGQVAIMDEYKITENIQPLLVENGGKVQNYTMLTSNLELQMRAPGREVVQEFVLGAGLIQEKSALSKLSFQGIEKSSIESMMTDRIYWHQDTIK